MQKKKIDKIKKKNQQLLNRLPNVAMFPKLFFSVL